MFGRKKMYKQGLADALRANEGFTKKQQAALEKLRQEVESGNKKLEDALSGLGEELNGIYQYLTSREKAALYHLDAQMDLKELDEEERRFLLAVLYQLAEDAGPGLTEEQRVYIRSIQRYLAITNPQINADLTAVGEIDSLDVQKLFLRVCLEFFYLQDGDEFTDQQDVFMDNFSVNKKQANVIESTVSRHYNIMGRQGLAEKYGYVPEQEPEAEAAGQVEASPEPQPVATTHLEITKPLQIQFPAGKKVLYQNKIVHIRADVECGCALEFNGCVIRFGENGSEASIHLSEDARLTLRQCTVVCHSVPNDENKFFIKYDGQSDVVFSQCEFRSCGQFLGVTQGADVLMEYCQANGLGVNFISRLSGWSEVKDTLSHCDLFFNSGSMPKRGHIISASHIFMDNSRVQGSLQLTDAETEISEQTPMLNSEEIHIEKCSFCGISNIVQSKSIELSLSTFAHCSDVYSCANAWSSNDRIVELKDCRFDFCRSIGKSMPPKGRLRNCQYNHCFGQLIGTDLRGGLSIQNCEFNLSEMGAKERENPACIGEAMIRLRWCQGDPANQIQDCTFFGAKAHKSFLISSSTSDKLKYGFITNMQNCKFINCTTERSSGKFYNTYDTYYSKIGSKKQQEVTSVSGCEIKTIPQSDERCREIAPMTKNSSGIPLGVKSALENKIIGCAEG